uniref:FBA domain-containing protein n=1 Tax=Panagrolaimus sp. JU765 TaxID=591449 RepID=A0AC34Q3V8_9BILA
MDNHRPPITFTEWVSHRSDCGSIYMMMLMLYDKDNKCIAWEEQHISFVQWQNEKWHKMEITLKSYPPGGRVLRIYSAGRDTQFWAGPYGSKIAGSQLFVSMEETPPSNGNPTVAPGSAVGSSRYQPLE